VITGTTSIKPAKELPSKPSELIRVALEDLEKIEKNPRYAVDMDDWHVPARGVWNASATCKVCFAGAVMACRFGADPKSFCYPSDFERSETNKLFALNALRLGMITDGLEYLGVEPMPSIEDKDVARYEVDPELFKKDMQSLSEDLEKIGL
jgi:hypothetical protein